MGDECPAVVQGQLRPQAKSDAPGDVLKRRRDTGGISAIRRLSLSRAQPRLFCDDIRVTIQQIGAIDSKQAGLNMLEEGTPIVPVSIAYVNQYLNMPDADPPIGLCRKKGRIC